MSVKTDGARKNNERRSKGGETGKDGKNVAVVKNRQRKVTMLVVCTLREKVLRRPLKGSSAQRPGGTCKGSG